MIVELSPAEFLSAVADWPHTVTRFSERGKGNPDALWAVSSPEQLPALLARNARRALYFNPARPTAAALDSVRNLRLLKLAYLKRRDIAAARVLWADVDPPAAVKAAPAALAEWRAAMPARLASFGAHLLVDSGRGFWLFWLLEAPLQCGYDGRPGDPLKGYLESAAAYVRAEIEGVDSIANPDRVARLPGSRNQKTGNIARAYRLNEGRAALDDLPFGYTPAPPQPKTPPRRSRQGSAADRAVQRALDEHLYPDLDYPDWLAIGQALHAGGYSVELWRDWSARGDKYTSGECEGKWASFGADRGRTMGTFWALANDARAGLLERPPPVANWRGELAPADAEAAEREEAR